jgi:hypothetical protein
MYLKGLRNIHLEIVSLIKIHPHKGAVWQLCGLPPKNLAIIYKRQDDISGIIFLCTKGHTKLLS